MKRGNRFVAIVLAGMMLFSLTACGSTDTSSETNTATSTSQKEDTSAEVTATVSEDAIVDGGSLTAMIQTEPDSLDPFVAVAADTMSLLFNVYDGLMVLQDDGSVACDLAESYEISDDGLTYTFKIRDTACFSNGNAVTMDDVVYSYQKYASTNSMFTNVESVEGSGDTLTIKLKTPDASFITTVAQYGVAPDDDSIDLNETPIGSGPYMITSYTPGSDIVFEKNPYYNTNPDRVPHLDKITVQVNMSDSSVALNELLAGDLDLCQFMDPSSASTVEAQGYQVIAAPSNTVQIMAMNNDVEPFNNLEVRQAINYAIDKQAIVDTVMYGESETLDSHMSPAMSTYYADDLDNTYSLDLDKAQELLADAGYADGFSFTIKVPSSYQRHVDTALMIKDMLAKVNITVNVEQIEWATWLEDVYANRDYEATVIGIAGKPDPDTVMKIYTSTYDRNFYNYSNPEYDELIEEGKAETDTAARAEIYKQCQQILVDDAVCVYTMDPANVKYARNNVGGIKNYSTYFIDMASLYLTEE